MIIRFKSPRKKRGENRGGDKTFFFKKRKAENETNLFIFKEKEKKIKP